MAFGSISGCIGSDVAHVVNAGVHQLSGFLRGNIRESTFDRAPSFSADLGLKYGTADTATSQPSSYYQRTCDGFRLTFDNLAFPDTATRVPPAEFSTSSSTPNFSPLRRVASIKWPSPHRSHQRFFIFYFIFFHRLRIRLHGIRRKVWGSLEFFRRTSFSTELGTRFWRTRRVFGTYLWQRQFRRVFKGLRCLASWEVKLRMWVRS